MAEEKAGRIDLAEGTLLARAWLIASDAQHIELLLPEHYVAGQVQEIFLRDPGFHAVVERMRGFEAREAGKIRAAQREAMQECAPLLEHTALPIDKQIQEWRERESTKKLGNLEYDEEVAFCHADLCADKIRTLAEELEEE